MIRFGDMALGARFWYLDTVGDSQILVKMPPSRSSKNWNAFSPSMPIDVSRFSLLDESEYALENEGAAPPLPDSVGTLEFLLGQFVGRRGESKAADAASNVAAKALYRQLAADARLWMAAYEAGKKAGMYVDDEKDCNSIHFFRGLIDHLHARGIR